jgi:hypothetical protein
VIIYLYFLAFEEIWILIFLSHIIMTVGVVSSGCLLRFLVLALLVSVTLGFQSLSSTTKIVRIRNTNKLPRFSTPLSLSIHDVIPSSISVALEPLESYYVEQIPDIVRLFRTSVYYYHISALFQMSESFFIYIHEVYRYFNIISYIHFFRYL